MNTSTLAFGVSATGSDLTLTVTLDGDSIYQGQPQLETQRVTHHFDDGSQAEHVLVFELCGKLPEHTQLDQHGSIVSDRVITVSDLSFDDIQLDHVISQMSLYYHDHNGTTPRVAVPFHGTMGCNGRAELRFSTPIYLWLLENM